MKHSIRFKITFLLTALIIITIFLTWFINHSFLSDYYLYNKFAILDDAYQEINAVYKAEEDDALSDEDILKIEKISTKYGVGTYIYIDHYVPGFNYSIAFNMSEMQVKQMRVLLQGYIFYGTNPYMRNRTLLHKTENYGIYSMFDEQRDSNFIDLFGTLEDDKYIIMRTNYESIEESVAISNKFLAYIGIIAAFLGTAIMLIISKKFTQPILDLAGIAKQMSGLNFNIKYKVKTKDEIGVLGESINSLSDRLKSTISELKQANNELLSDIQKKTEVDEMRKEFLSNVSHELKTPLALIQGYAEGLKENINEDEESRDFYCEVIMDEAGKMNKMLKKLLSLNELEFGNNQVDFERFDIVELIRSVLESTEILFKQKEVVLHFEQEEPIYVWADEFLVEQVVTNYISNALNHVSGAKIIEIKLIRHNDVVRVAVFNTGENIPEEELDKIWIKFYKVDKARTREYGGSGIGLSIVKAIMNSLNQECGVINRPVGVEFWFELDTKA
ncbi:MAG TPA: two-component sensor histidine kinase [Lachnospiraceae bacterium]|nr:two-component sensor histidine kinase [Lachnospiraceae bacterium]HCM13370.1 two-component sensor histidine kinase [Lachnospiraceae bacterium]